VLACSIVLALAALVAGPVAGQPPPNSPCGAAPFHQFDFWLGKWEVAQKDGSKAGTSKVERILNGCVVMESWKGADGSVGHSFNQYDRQDKLWRQNWVDGQGMRLDLEGKLDGKRMVLRGERPNPRGRGTVLSEITWTPKDDGSVEQHWRISADRGKTWNDAFFGIYRRVKE